MRRAGVSRRRRLGCSEVDVCGVMPRREEESHERRPRSRADHRVLVGDRPPDGAAACGTRMDDLRDRQAARDDRRPRRGRVQDAGARRHRRGLDGGRGRGGRGRAGRRRGARQQRRLQPVGRRRDPAHGAPAPAVRDQRVRPRADVPAGAPEDAGRRARPHRQRQLDGRQARLSRRRRLPREQVRGRGALRRDALRAPRVRDPGRGHRARADHHRASARRPPAPWRTPGRRATRARPTRTRPSTPPSAPRRWASTRAR